MQYRTIGKTGLRVSEIGFGCGNNAVLMVKAPHQDQVKAVRYALDMGINFFDTAFAYGLGKSEENLGGILRELGAEPVVSTKIRLEADAVADLRAATGRAVEGGLSRLGRDRVDFVQLHTRVTLDRGMGKRFSLTPKDVLGPNGVVDGFKSMGYFVPKLLEETVGAKFNVIAGYQGGNEIDLAVERGEIQCRSLSSEAYFSREPFHSWRKRGFTRELVQGGRTRDEKLANTPTLFELMDKYKTPDAGRRLAIALLASGEFHRPYLAPPQIRPELVKTIREAFNKTMKDPEFLAETKRKKLDIDPTTGEEVEALTKDVMSQPPEVIERLKKMMKN